MTTTVVSTRFATRRRTAASWTSTNEVLYNGEIGFETDTYKFKIGDGVTAWNDIPDYFTVSGAGGGTWGSITGTLSAQTDLQAALDGKEVSGAAATAQANAIAAAATDATTKANAAQAAAISAASTDATTKANAAQSAAISAAATDATTKANAAQSNAIATASADATSKANAAQAAAIAASDPAGSAAAAAAASVPVTRTVNGQALSANISLTAANVGAPSGSGTSTGTNTGDQTNISGNAATVTTNANLTGHVTSTGNAAILGSFTAAELSAAVSDDNPAYVGAANTFVPQQTFAAGTITTSQPLRVTQTWNAGGVTFNGVLVNVTDSASAAASSLIDLQVGGVTQFRVSKIADIVFSSGTKAITGASNLCFDTTMYAGATTVAASRSKMGNGFSIGTAYQYEYSSTTAANGTPDLAHKRHAAGVWQLNNGTIGNVRALQGGGTAVASATALPLPTGRVFHVTGTTNVTSITSTNFQSGVVITIIFDGVLTFTDGNNLKLAGNFTTAADSTITLAYDGTNWYECSRSTN